MLLPRITFKQPDWIGSPLNVCYNCNGSFPNIVYTRSSILNSKFYEHTTHSRIILVIINNNTNSSFLPSFWPGSHQWAMASSFMRFLDQTQRRIRDGRIPLDEWSAPSQRPLPDKSQHSQQKNSYASGGIRTHDLSRRAAADLRLRPRGCWDIIQTILSK